MNLIPNLKSKEKHSPKELKKTRLLLKLKQSFIPSLQKEEKNYNKENEPLFINK